MESLSENIQIILFQAKEPIMAAMKLGQYENYQDSNYWQYTNGKNSKRYWLLDENH